MTTKHTPGPWEVRPSSREGNGSQWRDIVSLGGAFTPAYVGEALEADARLIAAAPEMAAALKTLAQEFLLCAGEGVDPTLAGLAEKGLGLCRAALKQAGAA